MDNQLVLQEKIVVRLTSSENKDDKESLNIAMVGHKRIPSREGGIEIVVEELSRRLVERGHKVTAYNRMGHHVCGKEFDGFNHKKLINSNYYGTKIITVPTLERKGLAAVSSSFFATIFALWACRKESMRYDCIHYHAEGPSIMLWLPHVFHIRTVVTIHGLDWQRAKWGGFATGFLKLGEKIAAKYADEVIVLSKNVQQYFRDTYNRETVFISNGIDKPEIKVPKVIKDKWNLQKDEYILFLGRIVPEKGLHYLIESFRKVDTNKKLVIAGGASDTNGFMQEIKENAKADDRIVFTGFVQGQELEELFSNAYLYVLPSDVEGMPLSLLEAMSYGNCCLVSDIPECIEVVEDKAVSFKKSNVEDLREKLEELCQNPVIVDSYKTNASSFICGKYNWNEVAEKTAKLYKKKESLKYENFNGEQIPLS